MWATLLVPVNEPLVGFNPVDVDVDVVVDGLLFLTTPVYVHAYVYVHDNDHESIRQRSANCYTRAVTTALPCG
jgi:hypothetical protein